VLTNSTTVAQVASGRPTNFTLEWIREINATLYHIRHCCWHRRHEYDGEI